MKPWVRAEPRSVQDCQELVRGEKDPQRVASILLGELAFSQADTAMYRHYVKDKQDAIREKEKAIGQLAAELEGKDLVLTEALADLKEVRKTTKQQKKKMTKSATCSVTTQTEVEPSCELPRSERMGKSRSGEGEGDALNETGHTVQLCSETFGETTICELQEMIQCLREELREAQREQELLRGFHAQAMASATEKAYNIGLQVHNQYRRRD